MVFEKFDGIDATLVRNTLDEVATNALKIGTKLMERIAGWYELSDDRALNNKVNEVFSEFRTKLESKILVVE